MRRQTSFNPKRRICTGCEPALLVELAQTVTYGGNTEHKRDPGDFGLTPPSQPRADKTLCDAVNINTRSAARRVLRAGAKKGLISEQTRGKFPQNIWAVTADGHPLEAQLENSLQGIYYGYPMPSTDPFRNEVLDRWNES